MIDPVDADGVDGWCVDGGSQRSDVRHQSFLRSFVHGRGLVGIIVLLVARRSLRLTGEGAAVYGDLDGGDIFDESFFVVALIEVVRYDDIGELKGGNGGGSSTLPREFRGSRRLQNVNDVRFHPRSVDKEDGGGRGVGTRSLVRVEDLKSSPQPVLLPQKLRIPTSKVAPACDST